MRDAYYNNKKMFYLYLSMKTAFLLLYRYRYYRFITKADWTSCPQQFLEYVCCLLHNRRLNNNNNYSNNTNRTTDCWNLVINVHVAILLLERFPTRNRFILTETLNGGKKTIEFFYFSLGDDYYNDNTWGGALQELKYYHYVRRFSAVHLVSSWPSWGEKGLSPTYLERPV